MFALFPGKKLAVCAALMLGAAGTAQAVPYEWAEWAGDIGRYIDDDHSYSYQHNITHGLDGYRPGTDSISNASLSIWLFDDAFFGDIPFLGDSSETVGFRFDGGEWTSSQSVGGNILFWDDFDFVVSSLLSDGVLNVTIRANRGDFRFGASHLWAWGDRSKTVPEPATLTLLGVALLGLGFVARRRARSVAS